MKIAFVKGFNAVTNDYVKSRPFDTTEEAETWATTHDLSPYYIETYDGELDFTDAEDYDWEDEEVS